MKKLNKLQINPERIIINEELLALRGGYDGDDSKCGVSCSSNMNCGGSCPTCHETAGGWPRPTCQAM